MLLTREIQQTIEQNLFPGEGKQPAIIIYGARQVGKTTLMNQILAKFQERSAYFNCDFLDVQQRFSWENITQIGELIKDVRLLILDEAQRIKNIGLVLKILVDEFPNVQVIATGSSSFDLSNQINEPLTGRKKVFTLHPFSFREVTSNQNLIEKQRMVQSKLRFGMYPGLLGLDEKNAEMQLNEICGSYLYKDIFTFQQIKKPEVLDKLLKLIALQIGQEVSYQELANTLRIDQTVVQRYIQLLEDSFVIFRLTAFSRNLRNEISKGRKIYFWDLGIRNSLIQNFNNLEMRNDTGALWENFCITEHYKYQNNRQISAHSYFWRTYQQKEIDYIEEANGKIAAFEFKWSGKKKFRIPKDFQAAYPDSSFEVITPENSNLFF